MNGILEDKILYCPIERMLSIVSAYAPTQIPQDYIKKKKK